MEGADERGKKVGVVFKYFAKVGVAAITLTDAPLQVGDQIRIVGATTDITQTIESMEIDRNKVERAEPGQSVGIMVKDRVRENDMVYKI